MFKVQLNKVYTKSKKNSYYYYGDRRVSSFLSSVRTMCSQLRNDLFKNKILLNNTCTCGLPETAYHYFFECPNYIVQRDQLFNDTLFVQNLTLHIILHGSTECSEDQNILLFEAVFK